MEQHGPNIEVVSATYIPVGTYQPQSLRPYTTTVAGGFRDPGLINNIANITRGGQHITSQTFVGENTFLVPDSNASFQAVINNGWGEQRRIFVIRLRVTDFSTSYDRFLYGYTEYDGFTLDGLVDENMIHVVNSHVDVTQRTLRNAYGHPYLAWEVLKVNQLLKANIDNNMYTNVAMRPEDVIRGSESCVMEDYFPGLVDTRLNFSSGIKFSQRENNSAGNYLARTINAFSKAHGITEGGTTEYGKPRGYEGTGGYSDAVGFAQTASSICAEDTGDLDVLFAGLNVETNRNFLQQGTFTFSQLQRITPMLAPRVIPRTSSGPTFSHAADSEHWMGADNNTIGAITIAQSVPGILLSNLIPGAKITVTNQVAGLREAGRRYLTHMVLYDTLVDMVKEDVAAKIEESTFAIESEIIDTITRNGLMDITLTIDCNCYQEIIIDIAVGDQPMTRYVDAAFADALIAPTIAGDVGTLKNLGSDVKNLVSTIWEPNTRMETL